MTHPFERTLGPGPYRLVGVVVIHKGEYGTQLSDVALAQETEAGIGTCAHCGHPIMNCYVIRTGEGKLYGVGSDCITKTAIPSDPLLTQAQKAKKLQDRKVRKAREVKAKQAALDQLYVLMNNNTKYLSRRPHPSAFHAVKGLTYLDYVDFVAKGALNSKRLKALIKAVEVVIWEETRT